MNAEKQIEEMRKLEDELRDEFSKSVSSTVKQLYVLQEARLEAVLKANGWRKASDVAREICAEIGERFKSLLGTLPANGAFTDAKTFIEAHWEFIEHSIVFAYDAELKKKYTQEK